MAHFVSHLFINKKFFIEPLNFARIMVRNFVQSLNYSTNDNSCKIQQLYITLTPHPPPLSLSVSISLPPLSPLSHLKPFRYDTYLYSFPSAHVCSVLKVQQTSCLNIFIDHYPRKPAFKFLRASFHTIKWATGTHR